MANKMMGVVLWSDSNDENAVFWCEDHGDLAYFNAKSVNDSETVTLEPGDMVQFEITVESKTRRAHNARIIEQQVCNGLQDGLRLKADQDGLGAGNMALTGKVIPFHDPAKAPFEARKIGNG